MPLQRILIWSFSKKICIKIFAKGLLFFFPLSNVHIVHPWRRSPWRNWSRHAGAVFGAAGASGAAEQFLHTVCGRMWRQVSAASWRRDARCRDARRRDNSPSVENGWSALPVRLLGVRNYVNFILLTKWEVSKKFFLYCAWFFYLLIVAGDQRKGVKGRK